MEVGVKAWEGGVLSFVASSEVNMSDYSHLRSSFWRGTSISTQILFPPKRGHRVTTQRHLDSLNRGGIFSPGDDSVPITVL